MFYETKSVVWGRVFANAVLTAFGTDPAAALLVTPKVRLSKDPAFAPTPDSTRAGLAANEADFTGYTAGGYTPTFSAPVRIGNNLQALLATVLPIRGVTLPGVNNTVFGWWIDNGTDVVVAESFAGGFQADFSNPGDFLDLSVVLPYMLGQSALG